jgi:hypothetical protein
LYEPTDGSTKSHHREQRGKDTPNAPLIEIGDGEPSGVLFENYQGRYEITGYDEEDVNPDEAAGKQ